MKRCTIFGHKFQPRYDYDPPVGKVKGPDGWATMDEMEQFVRACGRQTYVKDVCIRCGLSIDRDTFGKADDPFPLRKVQA